MLRNKFVVAEMRPAIALRQAVHIQCTGLLKHVIDLVCCHRLDNVLGACRTDSATQMHLLCSFARRLATPVAFHGPSMETHKPRTYPRQHRLALCTLHPESRREITHPILVHSAINNCRPRACKDFFHQPHALTHKGTICTPTSVGCKLLLLRNCFFLSQFTGKMRRHLSPPSQHHSNAAFVAPCCFQAVWRR